MLMKSRSPLIVEVLRGPLVESSHQVMLVTVNDKGAISGYYGNTDFVIYPRSSIKMLQAIPFVESGAMEKLGLEEPMLALACSSHRGERMHLELAARWMEKLHVSEPALYCGPSRPAHEGTYVDLVRKGVPENRVMHNCSGKHLGMISTAIALGEKHENYGAWAHPVQQRIRRVMTELTKVDHEKTPSGIDGCGIPTSAIPLDRLAIAMSHLLTTPVNSARKQAIQRILDACRRFPMLIGGTDDFVSVVNEKTKGRVIMKSGAEGVYTGLLPELGTAFALKVHDGHKRAAEVAAGFVLRSLKAITDKEAAELQSYIHPALTNSRGERVGEIRVQKG